MSGGRRAARVRERGLLPRHSTRGVALVRRRHPGPVAAHGARDPRGPSRRRDGDGRRRGAVGLERPPDSRAPCDLDADRRGVVVGGPPGGRPSRPDRHGQPCDSPSRPSDALPSRRRSDTLAPHGRGPALLDHGHGAGLGSAALRLERREPHPGVALEERRVRNHGNGQWAGLRGRRQAWIERAVVRDADDADLPGTYEVFVGTDNPTRPSHIANTLGRVGCVFVP
ncbi:MAG: hypothetical protein JWM10_5290 [Myxococcaceae bacterium]|nr:hypothetical protein [Myxococcaceae bacterium]